MIVVDSNVIAYCWLRSQHTATAQQVRGADADWQVPALWRSELRSILGGYLRSGGLSGLQVRGVMQHIEDQLAGCDHVLPSELVFQVLEGSNLSAYDAEFVALAHGLSVPLITEDKAILKAFPALAMSMAGFLARQPG